MFDKARVLGYAKDNPVEDVSRVKVPASNITPYTDDDVSLIFNELERREREGRDDRSTVAWGVYKELFYCMFYTGMRVSDAIKLSWEHVGDLKFATINIRQTKTSKYAQIRIPTAFVERLHSLQKRKQLQGHATIKGLIYVNTNGSPVEYQHLDRAIRIVLKSIGLNKKSPIHSFRHTVAKRLLDAKMPVHEVANQLGDTVETIVRNYVRPTVPSRALVDAAFEVGSRTGHANMQETVVLEVVRETTETPHESQKTLMAKGF
ncbi:MAG: site-specific integrase [bacterium]